MSITFDARKATHVAAYFLWRSSGTMPCRKLTDLMYLAEKECLLGYGERLTGDQMVSLPDGPSLPTVGNLFHSENGLRNSMIGNSPQFGFFLHENVVIDDADPLERLDELSCADRKILDFVYETYGHMTPRELASLLCNKEHCPEWEDPRGSSQPISENSLLMKNGKTKAETDRILGAIRETDDLQLVTRGLL